MENNQREKPFSSWKEIAAYLGCDERTCERWEKQHGLPVHRAGGGKSKSLVFAYKDELDEWLRHSRGEAGPKVRTQEAQARSGFFRRVLPIVALLPALVLVALGVSKFILKPRTSGPREPYDFKIERSNLIITNKKGAELWRYDTGFDDLMDEASYRPHFGSRKMDPADLPLKPWIKITDINGDGLAEVLMIVRTTDEDPRAGFVCLDSRGKMLWTYNLGREMTFGQKRFSGDYISDGMDILDIGPGSKEILIIARHRPEFPSYIVLLSPQGKEIGEYWNSGRIADYLLADTDDDGVPALVLVGTNNEYGKGFLAVLDPEYIWGGSPQTGDYRCPDLKPGSELFYLLFPRTEVDKLEFGQREVMSSVELLKDDRLMTVSQLGRIIYELRPSMAIDMVIVSDGYKERYRKHQLEGNIPPGTLDANALSDSLAKSIVYYDGEHWTTTATRNKRNLDIFLKQEARAKVKRTPLN